VFPAADRASKPLRNTILVRGNRRGLTVQEIEAKPPERTMAATMARASELIGQFQNCRQSLYGQGLYG